MNCSTSLDSTSENVLYILNKFIIIALEQLNVTAGKLRYNITRRGLFRGKDYFFNQDFFWSIDHCIPGNIIVRDILANEVWEMSRYFIKHAKAEIKNFTQYRHVIHHWKALGLTFPMILYFIQLITLKLRATSFPHWQTKFGRPTLYKEH